LINYIIHGFLTFFNSYYIGLGVIPVNPSDRRVAIQIQHYLKDCVKR